MKRWALALTLATAACAELTGGALKPVPPVHRVPTDVEGKTILIDEDATIESRDPVHLARAKERRIPQDYRAAMGAALALAGFKVVATAGQPHDLVAKLALAVREEKGKVFQTYRCGLRAPGGAEVAQIDWAWPQGTLVEENEVYDYATHNVATEIVLSPAVMVYLRRSP